MFGFIYTYYYVLFLLYRFFPVTYESIKKKSSLDVLHGKNNFERSKILLDTSGFENNFVEPSK